MARDIAETDLERRRQEWRAALTKRRELGLHFAGL
jgi:hypothetical protein